MVDPITPRQLAILQLVGKQPGLEREALLRAGGASAEDLAYLETHDLIRERDGRYRIAHFGEQVLRRARG